MLQIRRATSVEEMKAVYQLTHECYVAKGYASPQSKGLLLHYPEYDIIPDTSVLIAIENGEIIASMSCTLSGPFGMPIDHEFAKERKAVEEEGRVVVNIWRLIVKESHRGSRKMVFGLFSEGFRYTLEQKVTTWLLTVNPQHAGIYQRLFNAKILATNAETLGLAQAPATLLRFDREKLPPEWKVSDSAIQSPEQVGLFTLMPLFDKVPGLILEF